MLVVLLVVVVVLVVVPVAVAVAWRFTCCQSVLPFVNNYICVKCKLENATKSPLKKKWP